MPEGDTVWLAGRRLDAALGGQVLIHSDFRTPRLATADVAGRLVTQVVSRGKHLLFRFGPRPGASEADRLTLHTHFAMDGSWRLVRTGEPWRGGPAWQVRAVLTTRRWQAVGYRLPVVELLPSAAEQSVVGHLGPDLLGPDWDLAEALRRLRAAPERPVGEALLDQRNLAGIGNLYKAESCFLHGVTPWTVVADVPDLGQLITRARDLLLLNAERPEQITTGDARRGAQHYVFERAGRPCRRCGAQIALAEQGTPPQARLTYWCPGCQRGPSPTPGQKRPRPPAGRRRRP